MSDRKQTPDILSEMLGGESPPSPAAAPKEKLPTAAAQRRTSKPKRASPSKRRTPKPTQWEYMVVSFQEYRGWRPRYVNGRELKDWMDGPTLHEYLTEMGDSGWELTTASSGERLYGLSDKHQLYFKRPK